jgi:DNA-binding response OmpR family regulator
MTKRLLLFRWNPTKAEQTAEQLRKLGWQVDVEAEDGGRGSKAAKANPPDLLVFFLDQKASHSRATAEHLAEAKLTREVPMIFVGGEGDVLHKVRAAIHSAQFVSEEELEWAVQKKATQGKS